MLVFADQCSTACLYEVLFRLRFPGGNTPRHLDDVRSTLNPGHGCRYARRRFSPCEFVGRNYFNPLLRRFFLDSFDESTRAVGADDDGFEIVANPSPSRFYGVPGVGDLVPLCNQIACQNSATSYVVDDEEYTAGNVGNGKHKSVLSCAEVCPGNALQQRHSAPTPVQVSMACPASDSVPAWAGISCDPLLLLEFNGENLPRMSPRTTQPYQFSAMRYPLM